MPMLCTVYIHINAAFDSILSSYFRPPIPFMSSDNSNTIRLNKAISDTGFCSRREADKIIEQGRVTINGAKGVLGSKVAPGDVVKIDGKPIKGPQKTIYIAFNKPPGITCTTETHIKD